MSDPAVIVEQLSPVFVSVAQPQTGAVLVEDGASVISVAAAAAIAVSLAPAPMTPVVLSGGVGPAGPPGPGGVSATTFHQNTPATRWVIVHDLGRAPLGLDVFDGAGVLRELAAVVNEDSNTTSVTFLTPTVGSVVYS